MFKCFSELSNVVNSKTTRKLLDKVFRKKQTRMYNTTQNSYGAVRRRFWKEKTVVSLIILAKQVGKSKFVHKRTNQEYCIIELLH